MSSVSRIVFKMVKENPSLEIALSKNLINYSKLARYLRAEVEKEYGETVSDSAIVVALKRIKEKAGKLYEEKGRFHAIGMTSNSNMVEITIARSPRLPDLIKRIYSLSDVNLGSTVNITQSNQQVTFIFSTQIEDEIKRILSTEQVLSEIHGISQISIAFDKDMFDTPGFIVFALKELSWHNINIVEIISTYTELVIIVAENDFLKAYKLLRGVLF